MLVLNVSPASHGKIPILGGNIKPAAIHQAAAYLRSVPASAETGPGADPVVRKLFAAHPALSTLLEENRHALLSSSRIRLLTRQEVICRQDDPANTVILVLEGYVKQSRPLADGGEIFLDIAGPGDCAGEMAALEKRPYDADVTALSQCRLLLIDARQFRQILERQPEGLLAILRLANGRLWRVTEHFMDNRALAAPARLAKALLQLAQLPLAGPNGATCLLLRLSQSELGVMTNACREVVNKQLRAWRSAGWIGMSNGAVTSIHRVTLSKILENDGDCNTASKHILCVGQNHQYRGQS